ncbi:MAG: SCO family protein [Bacteroidia bacterium]
MRIWRKLIAVWCVLPGLMYGCGDSSSKKQLPYLGNPSTAESGEEGHPKIPEFQFVNQDGNTVSPSTFEDKIYVADFFFTSCPTICPKMKKEMLRVYEEFEDEDEVALLSHTIDPVTDDVQQLHEFAEKLGVKSSKWHFVTGSRDELHGIADHYLASAMEDADAPGGFLHSGTFVLIDKQKHIRGAYDGTDPSSVDVLMADMKILLDE